VKRVQTKLHNLPVLTHCGFYEWTALIN
jgi:hypothetical protein